MALVAQVIGGGILIALVWYGLIKYLETKPSKGNDHGQ
jgi:hypothetical protein